MMDDEEIETLITYIHVRVIAESTNAGIKTNVVVSM